MPSLVVMVIHKHQGLVGRQQSPAFFKGPGNQIWQKFPLNKLLSPFKKSHMKRGISSSLRPCLSVSPGHGLLKVSELVSVPSANDRSKLSSIFELSYMPKPGVFTCLYGLLTKVDDLKEKMYLVWV